jgi:hypothetical protein
MSDDPFDVQSVQTESAFMRALAELIRKHRNSMDTSTMAGDLERSLAALDDKMLDTEWGAPHTPRYQEEEPLHLDESLPVTAPAPKPDDRDHRIAQLEATVKDLMAKMNK